MSDRLWPDRAIGVFETLLIVDGAPIELHAHLRRLSGSVRDLFAAEPPADTRDLVLESASALPLGRVRLTVAPGPTGVLGADAVAASVDPEDVFPSWERAVALRPFLIRGGLGAHKWADQWADRAGLPWTYSESDRCLPLVLDAGGELLEASRANVFAVEGEAILTPPADGRILPGVARARTIETARALGIELLEERLTIDRLVAAGEAFLTGSVRGVEPVRSVGAAELTEPGGAARELAAQLKRTWMGTRATSWEGAAPRVG